MRTLFSFLPKTYLLIRATKTRHMQKKTQNSNKRKRQLQRLWTEHIKPFEKRKGEFIL